MSVGSIGRIKGPLASNATEMRKGMKDTSERDPNGHGGYKEQARAQHLTPEQEAEALKALNEHPSFSRNGLTAELVKAQDGKAPHLVVRDASGKVVRHIPYSDMIDIYVNRKSGNEKGQLLKRAA